MRRYRAPIVATVLALTASLAPAAAQTPPAASPASPAPATQRSPERNGAPAPTAAASPSGLMVPGVPGLGLSGALRAYDFNRQNVPLGHGSNPNREAFNLGGNVRLEYKLQNVPLTLGTAYWAADPLGVNGNNTILKKHDEERRHR